MIDDVILSEKNVEVICGFLRSPQNCRGYDLKTPIGKIADCAFRHHNLKDRSIFELEKKLEVANSLLEGERQKSARLNTELEKEKINVRKAIKKMWRAIKSYASVAKYFYDDDFSKWDDVENKAKELSEKFK